jgi:hypothetical protein
MKVSSSDQTEWHTETVIKGKSHFNWKALFLIFISGVMLSRCGIAPVPAPLTATPPPALVIFPTPPKDWKVYATPTFQLSLPEGWQEIILAEAALTAIIRQNQSTSPELSRSLQGLLDSGQYKDLLFYATDTKAAGIISNVIVAHAKPGGEARSEDIAKKAAESLAKDLPSAKNVMSTALVSINGIDASQVKYDLPIKDSGGNSVLLRGIQFYFLVSPQDVYALTISGDAASDTFPAKADQIGRSFVAVKR